MIDVLRGFAALTVLVYHFVAHMNWVAFPISGPLLWFRIGWMGVDLFFVISGFVICLSAFSMLDSGAEFYKTFVIHRLARIVPLYYATCLIFVLFIRPELIFQQDWLLNFGSHLLFIHNIFALYQGSIDGSNWSLGVEMQFYIVIMLLAPMLRRAPWWSIAIVFTAMAWAWRYYAFQTTSITGPLGPYPLFWKSTQIFGCIDEFAIGIILAKMASSKNGRAIFELGRRFPVAPVALATVTIWAVLAFYWHYDATFWNSKIMVIPFRTALAFAFGCVVFAACCIQGPLMSLLALPARYLGKISYGIYLWHLPIILALQRLQWLSAPRAFPVVILLTLIFSAGSWHFFEKPLIDRARLALRSRKNLALKREIVPALTGGNVKAKQDVAT